MTKLYFCGMCLFQHLTSFLVRKRRRCLDYDKNPILFFCNGFTYHIKKTGGSNMGIIMVFLVKDEEEDIFMMLRFYIATNIMAKMCNKF